tara:strand:+ start:1195 stop:2802 length:1608 start_codon:yes stop_codon:yes gene_type:complete
MHDLKFVKYQMTMKNSIGYVASISIAGLLAGTQILGIPANAQSNITPEISSDYGEDTFQATNAKLKEMMDDFEKRSKPYDLEEAINFSIANNPSIQAAYRSVQSKQWSAISDKRLWWPTASGAGPYGDTTIVPTWPTLGQRYSSSKTRSYVKADDGNLKKTNGSYTVLDAFTPAIQARWTFFDMARGAQINGSTEAAKAEELVFNMTVRNTVLNVQQNYYALYSILKHLKGLEIDYESNCEQLKEAERRYVQEPSLLNQNAVAQSKSTLYNHLQQLVKVKIKLLENAATLSQAMGLPVGTLIKPADSFEMRATGSWSLSLMETIDHALAHREEIKTSLTIAKSQNYLATSLNYSYIPKLSLYGYADFTSQDGIYGASDTSKKSNKSWTWGPSANIGLMLSWTFDGTVADAKSRSLRYAAKQSEAKAKAAQDMVESQTATTYAQYTMAKMSLDTSQAALANAKQARETSKRLYKQGRIDATAYATTSNSLSQASEDYSKAIFDYNNSLAKLYRYTSIWPSGISKQLDEAVQILKEG